MTLLARRLFYNQPKCSSSPLIHVAPQMMLSGPEECMLCQEWFESSSEIRFCPCCAMVCCYACVRKRAFEVVSRQVRLVGRLSCALLARLGFAVPSSSSNIACSSLALIPTRF